MPNTFEITIKNESSKTRSYILFAEVPAVSTTPGKLFQNAWMTAKPIISKVDGSSQTKFTITDQFYAICGASVEDLEGGVTIATSDYDAVDLGKPFSEFSIHHLLVRFGCSIYCIFGKQSPRNWSTPPYPQSSLKTQLFTYHIEQVPVMPAAAGPLMSSPPRVQFSSLNPLPTPLLLGPSQSTQTTVSAFLTLVSLFRNTSHPLLYRTTNTESPQTTPTLALAA